MGRLGPKRAKNTAPVNFLAPERGVFWCPEEPHFWAVQGPRGPKIRLPSISWPKREVFLVSRGAAFLGRLGPKGQKYGSRQFPGLRESFFGSSESRIFGPCQKYGSQRVFVSSGAAFLGRSGPKRAKNTAPVNFLAPERGFFGVSRSRIFGPFRA